jgi:hypothetical protein
MKYESKIDRALRELFLSYDLDHLAENENFEPAREFAQMVRDRAMEELECNRYNHKITH